jgi:hypothetical protein
MPRPTAVRWRRPVLALVLLLAAAGCARPAGAPTPGPAAAAPIPHLLRTADLRLPLDAYLASVAEVAELGSGYRALLRRCMAGYGFDFPPADPPAGPSVGPSVGGPRTRNERRYGLTDPAAASHGYRLANGASPARPDLPALPAAALAALNGAPGRLVAGRAVLPDGCAGQAGKELAAQVPPGADLGLPDRLARESFERSRQDPRVAAATRRWATCMRGRGYSYATPSEAAADPRFRGPLSRAETATAAADVDCKRQTNLVGIWFTVESADQRTLIAANQPALTLAATALKAELLVARTRP